MIKTHTAQSLAKYLGKDVVYPFDGQKDKSKLSAVFNSGIVWLRHESPLDLDAVQAADIYPILKTYEKLLEPMEHDGKRIIPIEYVYGYVGGEILKLIDITPDFVCDIYFIPHEKDKKLLHTEAFYLIELGFGAIKNEESPTGYVDLFGYPCVNYDEG